MYVVCKLSNSRLLYRTEGGMWTCNVCFAARHQFECTAAMVAGLFGGFCVKTCR